MVKVFSRLHIIKAFQKSVCLLSLYILSQEVWPQNSDFMFSVINFLLSLRQKFSYRNIISVVDEYQNTVKDSFCNEPACLENKHIFKSFFSKRVRQTLPCLWLFLFRCLLQQQENMNQLLSVKAPFPPCCFFPFCSLYFLLMFLM